MTMRLKVSARASHRQPTNTLLKTLRTLVVDDNETNLRILGKMLANWNVPAQEAPSAQIALKLLAEGAGQGVPFDLLLCDGKMPEVDGFRLAEQVRQNPVYDRLKILMLSSADLLNLSEQLERLKISRFLIKPVAAHDLREAIVTTCAGIIPSLARARHRPAFSEALCRTRHPLKILVAEDNLVNQKLARKVLEKIGHTVTIANNGREAIEWCEKDKFDVVLMDLQMPEMDGLSATAEIRRRPHLANQKIYAVNAHAMTGDREKCLEIGMNGYLTKPLQLEELRKVLTEIEADVTNGYVSV